MYCVRKNKLAYLQQFKTESETSEDANMRYFCVTGEILILVMTHNVFTRKVVLRVNNIVQISFV
jgi:hypothetical protein